MATDLTNVAVSTGYVQLLHIDGGVGGSVTRVYDGDGTGTPLQISTSEVQILDGAYNFDVASHDGTNGLKLGGTLVTSSAAELNYNDISTLGTAQASKVLTVDSSLDVTGIRNLTATGTVTAANFTGTGNTQIGDAAADTVAINATITTNLIFEGSTANAYETTLAITDPTADRTWTIPDSTDTFVGKATSDTLTNKVLTAPDINTPDIDGGTVDAITTLTVANSVDIGNYTLTANGLTIDGTFTDGSLSIASGSITSAVNGTFSGTVQAEQLTTTDDLTVSGLATIGETLAVTGVATFTAQSVHNGGLSTGALVMNDGSITDTSGTINFGNENLTSTGVGTFASLDISGNADIDGTLEADAYTVDGTTLAEYIADTAGAMVSSNTESGITVTYQDGDNTIDLSVDAAQTGITSIYATDLILGEDSQTAIDFGTANEIDFKADNAARLTLTASALYPVTDNQIDLGTSSLEFKDAFFDGTVTSDAFAGPLTGDVTGTLQTAAQGNVTSLGTLTALTVDNLGINGNTITANSGALNLTPASGSAIVLDGTISVDAGVVTGATSITSTAFVGNVTGTSSKATVTDSTANTNFPVVFHNESDGLLDDTGALRYNPSTGTLLAPNLVVAGTTSTVDTVTMEAANAIIFEGATADGNETTLSIVDPTADHTQYLINQGGYIPLLAASTTTAISSTPAELNILDGATLTVAELNIMDADTVQATVTLAGTDGVVISDGTVMKQALVSDFEVYMEANLDTMGSQFTSASSLATVGALNSGSITSGFGTIDTGSSTITTTGLISGGSLDIDNVLINGTTIGHTDDTDLITVADGLVTVAGEISVTTLDIGGTNVSATASELNIMDGSATTQATVTLVAGDGVVISDADVMKQCLMSDFEVYMEANLDTMGSQFTSASSLATVGTITTGVWNAGAVTSSGAITGATIDATTDFTIGGLVITDGQIADTGTLALVPVDGCTIALGSDAGDDFNIDGGKLVVEGDTGRVGIGTATPETELDVIGDIQIDGGNSLILKNRGSAPSALGNRALLYTTDVSGGDASLFVIDEAGAINKLSGNVGIGTAAPSHVLTAVGQCRIDDGSLIISKPDSGSYNWRLLPHSTAAGDLDFQVTASTNTNYTTQATNFATKFMINKDGDVGIGVTDPEEKLEVAGNILLSNNSYLKIEDASAGNQQIIGFTSGNLVAIAPGGQNVGIGTTSAGTALTFVKDSTISIATSVGSDDGVLVIAGAGASGSTRGATIRLYGNENGQIGRLYLDAGNPASGGEIFLRTGGTERVAITRNGNCGIGTTVPGQLLDCNSGGGNMIADGYDTHSLAVYKENIEDASGYLDKVLACPAQKWNRKPFVSADEIKEAVLEEFGEDVLIEEAVESKEAVLDEDGNESEPAVEAKDAVYEKQYSVWDELFPESHRQKALYNMPDGDLKTWIDDWCEAKRVEMRPEDKWQKKRLGLVADAELTAEHLPEVVSINDDGEPTGIDTMTYIGILHNAIQELSAKVEALENA